MLVGEYQQGDVDSGIIEDGGEALPDHLRVAEDLAGHVDGIV